MSNRNKTISQLAEIIGVSVATIKGYNRLGLPHDSLPKRGGYRYDSSEVSAWMESKNRTGRVGKPAEVWSPELAELKRKKELELVRRLKRENDEADSKLLDAETARKSSSAKVEAVRSKLMPIGNKLSPLLEGLSGPERQKLIDDAMEAICRDFAKVG